MMIKCDNCSKEFYKKPSHVAKARNHFCCTECHNFYRHNKTIERFNELVSDDFKTWLTKKYLDELLSIRQISKILYGKETVSGCVRDWLMEFNIPMRHGSEAIKTQWIDADERRDLASKRAKENLLNPEVREKIKETQRTKQYRVKSREAKLGEKNGMYDVLGENHPRWNLSRTDEQRIKERKTHLDGRFRKAVLKRDNRTCQCCGHSYDIMIVHHLDSYTTFPNARYEVENGVTLCEYCHIKYHKTYDATKEQFNLFLSENHLNKV